MTCQGLNRKLKELASDAAGLIEGYINSVKNRYSINLNLHDIAGISSIDPSLERIFAPYKYHNNPFCNYIKRNDKTFAICCLKKNRLCSCCVKRDKPFYGRCYMGIEELIYPVRWKHKLIAILCIGQFFSNIDSSLKRIRYNAELYKLDACECEERFLNTAKKIDFDINSLSYDVGILCEYISLLYDNFMVKEQVISIIKDPAGIYSDAHKNSCIVNSTIRFIKENYKKDLSLDILASNAYCNTSYLSYIFKEKMNIGITDYINQVRIDAAKQLLDITGKTITEISSEVGYNDSSYFARVFKQRVGLSPSEYRQRKS